MPKESTRDQILDSAIDLFWSKSYHGVNMNELSCAAGVNKATIYQYFGSKEELVVTALERVMARTQEYVYQESISQNETPEEQLSAIFDRAYSIHLEISRCGQKSRGCPFVNLGVELCTSSETIREVVNRAMAAFKSHFAQIVALKFKSNNSLSSLEIAEMADSLMANMNASLVQSKFENRPEAIIDGKARALRILAV